MAPRLENLQSALRTAYRLVSENSRKAHLTNKRYFDRRAKERSFEPGDTVYLFSPAKKPGQNSKFWTPWTGPFQVVARLSKLNYRVRNMRGKESVVHINRLKRAYKQGIQEAKGTERCYRRQRPRRQEREEDEPVVSAPGPIPISAPQAENRQPGLRSPNRISPRAMDTPETEPHRLDTPGSQRADPNYVPPDTPRSRRELGATRAHPPVTRLRSRLQAVQETPDEGDE